MTEPGRKNPPTTDIDGTGDRRRRYFSGPSSHPLGQATGRVHGTTGDPCRELQDRRGRSMIGWGGRLIVLYGATHTIGAFVAEGAARHIGAWFRGGLRGADLSTMSPEMSAYWLSVNSFGPFLVVIGSTVLWLNRRSIIPPRFIAYSVSGWAAVDAVVTGPGVGQNLILIAGCALLAAGVRRARRVASRRGWQERGPGTDRFRDTRLMLGHHHAARLLVGREAATQRSRAGFERLLGSVFPT